MKKLFLLFISIITCFSLTACNNFSLADELSNYIDNELHDYTFKYDTNYDTGEITKTSKINNDVATAILMLQNYIPVNFSTLLSKANSSIEEVTSTYENMSISDEYTAFNMILVYKILDLDLTDLENHFRDLSINDFNTYVWYEDEEGQWHQATDDNGDLVVVFDYNKALTVINCLNMLSVNTILKNILIEKFDNINDVDYLSADTAAMVIVSLQGYASKDYLDYILKSITSNGVLNYYDEVSCSTTAQVLMAFMSQGTVYKDNILIDYVMNFRCENGFKEYLDEDTRDIAYASPQAFLALTTAYLFEETSNRVLFY